MKETKKDWMERITVKQSVIITLVYFVALISCIVYANDVIKPYTGTLRSVTSGTHGRTASIYYRISPKKSIDRSVFPLFGSVTGRIELHRLGVPANVKNLDLEVSYLGGNFFVDAPVGLRLGKDNYPKDFWYYWTLYSSVSTNIFFTITTYLFCGIGIFSDRNGVTGEKVAYYRIFCALYILFAVFIL